jgi:hypothetical protein
MKWLGHVRCTGDAGNTCIIVGNPEREPTIWKDIGIGERITLKWIFMKECWRLWNGFVLLWTTSLLLWTLKWTFIFDLRWHFLGLLGVSELLKACKLMCHRRCALECFGSWNRPLFHKQCRSWCLYTQFKQGSTTRDHLKIPSARRVARSKFIQTTHEP